ncbi:Transcriptional regulatory protein LiaR [Anaerolineales bacterium]|nr:Transcriptional regulatory protein LiaR [Anaerolineales bacterium]
MSDLARAIIAASRGEIVLPPSIALQALTTLARGEPIAASPSEPFTERKVDVLRMLGQGLTNKDIAQTLILSVRTVDDVRGEQCVCYLLKTYRESGRVIVQREEMSND